MKIDKLVGDNWTLVRCTGKDMLLNSNTLKYRDKKEKIYLDDELIELFRILNIWQQWKEHDDNANKR